MSADAALPLNEPQQRHIAIALASLEKHLADLREQLERGPRDLRLTHYADRLSAEEAATLLPAVRSVEAQLRKIADDLGLPVTTEPVRRTFTVALEFSNIHLYECRPECGLTGYGKVAPATADYLEREIPKLDAAVQSLIALLQQAPAPSHVTT
jgi:hypothetical protein